MEGAVRYDTVRRTIAIAGGLLFVASLLYLVACYVWRFDAIEPSGDTAPPILVDLVLFTVFALHHSLFARFRLKEWVRRTLSASMERSAYVWLSSILLIALCAWWQPVPGQMWHATGAMARLLQLAQLAGGVLCVLSARRLDVMELAGVRQAFTGGVSTRPPHLDTSGPYAFVRHPIYFGWMMFVWLPPIMSGTRLVFAAISTLYLALAVPFEERDLIRTFGSAYTNYRRRVQWRMVPWVY
jgi:protein-S-isoprenylcysteine O-methyltransferase Ste14